MKNNNEYMRSYYKSNVSYQKSTVNRASKWNKENTEVRREIRKKSTRKYNGYTETKSKAISRGLLWELTKDQYNQIRSRSCYYCDDQITSISGGLDRIDNNLGYSFSNVLPCCIKCNQTRNRHYTVEETKIMINALKEFRKRDIDGQ